MAQTSFPPEGRLRSSAEFRVVFGNGQRYVRAGLVVIAAPGQSNISRLGLAVAKKRVPLSVDRNRVKRLIRESFRHNRGRLGAIDVVVLARNGTAQMPNRRLFGQLRSIWHEIVESGDNELTAYRPVAAVTSTGAGNRGNDMPSSRKD